MYRIFVKQTEAVVQYLSLARSHEHSTRLEIPKIKHAPTSLTASLEEYLNDKDFEINRRQYLAEREAKKNGGKLTNGSSKPQESKPATQTASANQAPAAQPKPNSSAPLIDLFASLEDNQQTMATQPMMAQQYPQQAFQQQQQGFQMPQQTANTGFVQQQQPFSPQNGQGTNPFQMQQQLQAPQMQIPQQQMAPPQIQSQFTGAGFGGYTPQPFSPQNTMSPIPQNGIADFQQQQQQQQMQQPMQIPTIAEPLQAQQTSTNPFRQSMMPSPTGPVEQQQFMSSPTGATSLNRSSTNPFAKHNTGFQQASQSPSNASPFAQPPAQSSSPFAPMQQQPLQPLQPAPTGTNPFARQPSPQSATSPQGGLTVNATGSTNPFRQSAFVNQQTGQGWQSNGQGTLGGMSLDRVPTQSVFPRPGQQQQQQNFLG